MKFNAPSGNAVHFRLFSLHGSVLFFSVSVVRYIRSHRDFLLSSPVEGVQTKLCEIRGKGLF